MNFEKLETFAKEMLPHYLDAAVFADSPQNQDALYDAEESEGFEFSEEAEHLAFIDCLWFCRTSYPWFGFDNLTPEQVGHNLWLSRNGHGTGFWDRGFHHGDFLDERAKRMGTCDLYLSDQIDGILYLELN